MKLPGDLGRLDFSDWFYGLISGFIGGGAGAVTSGITLNLLDPNDFNVYTSKFYITVGAMFLANGTMTAMGFLRQKPLPTFKTVETTVRTTEQRSEPPTIVTTVKETVTAPVSPADLKEEKK